MKVIEGERITRHRKRMGYTQRDLSKLVGCSQNAISLIETGKMPTVSTELAEKIAKRLGHDVEEYFIERLPTPSATSTSGKSAGGRRSAA